MILNLSGNEFSLPSYTLSHVEDRDGGNGDRRSFNKEASMTISLTQVLIWILIAAVVGVVGELLARRRAPDGIVGAIIVGLLAIFLMVGIFHFQITGEPLLDGVPLISSIIVAALLSLIHI